MTKKFSEVRNKTKFRKKLSKMYPAIPFSDCYRVTEIACTSGKVGSCTGLPSRKRIQYAVTAYARHMIDYDMLVKNPPPIYHQNPKEWRQKCRHKVALKVISLCKKWTYCTSGI